MALLWQPIAKFDEAQHPRNKQGRFVTLYHGTRQQHVDAIYREGLKPGKVGLVWATESREAAQQFAEGLNYPNPTPEAAVVELRVPKGAFFFEKPLTPGKKDPPGTRVARFAKGVRPEWVVKFQEAQHPRDAHGRFTETASIHVGGRDINVVKPLRAEGDALVPLDVAKFDPRFAADLNFYLSEGGGKNAIGNRYQRFEDFINQNDSIEAPEVYVGDDGTVGFTNGRHRYAWLRDHGITTIPVSMDWESVRNAKKHGYLSKQIPTTMRPRPAKVMLKRAFDAPAHSYGNTQISISPTSAAALSLNNARNLIEDDHLEATGKAVDGNHVTVRYGLLNDDLDALRAFLARQQSFEARVDGVELFDASEHSDGAVPVVAKVFAPELHDIEAEIGKYADFTEKNFPVYKPHATLAYCKPEIAERYADLPVYGTFVVQSITISHSSGVQETIPFGMAVKWDESQHPRDQTGKFRGKSTYVPDHDAPEEGEWDWTGVDRSSDPKVQIRNAFLGIGPKWRQKHYNLVRNAMQAWTGSPSNFRNHVQHALEGAPQPDSGSGKHMRAQAEALLWELENNVITTPVPLYRGSGVRGDIAGAGAAYSWSEDRRIAAKFAKQYGGVVETLPAGARGLRLRDYHTGEAFGEKHWIVRAGNPALIKKKQGRLWEPSKHPRLPGGHGDKSGEFTRLGSASASLEVLYGPKDALDSLLDGEKNVNIDRNDVRRFMELAAELPERLDPDLTDLQVEGMEIFGGNGLGIPRIEMPQIPKEHRAGFMEFVRDHGVGGTYEDVDPLKLKPTQTQVSARNAAQKLLKYEKGGRTFPPVLVAENGRILDGHHHWGAIAAYALDDPTATIPIYRFKANTKVMLALMFGYMKKHGLKRKDISGAVQKADPATGRYVTPFVSFDKQGDDLLRLIASLNSSRLATWGFTAEAEVRGIARYRVTAVLDGRTSDFCRFIDGKIFEVPDAREKVIEVLNVQNPEDLRVVQPWPKQTKAAMQEYREMDADELTDLGLHIPPYHPYCRTLLKPVVSSTGDLAEDMVTETVPAEVETFQPVTMADLAELGVEATQENVDQWNTHVGMSPVELLSRLSGMPPQEVMTKGQGVGANPIQFEDSGNIALKARGEVSGVEFQLGALLDPFTGIYYLTKADLMTGTPLAEVKFLKRMFNELIGIGEVSSAKSLAVGVAGNAAYYAKLGFMPDDIEWDTIRYSALESLDTTLKPLMASLSAEDQVLVKHLLQDKSVGALSALVDLPFVYEGRTLGEWVLGDIGGTWALDLLDEALVAQTKAYLS